jgi:alpha-L-rhamnosidase
MRFVVRLVLLANLVALPLAGAAALEKDFLTPPDSARPWVYFMVMDGNLTREGITADFEAMKRAGIGGVIFIEVNVGIPRGPVKFMSAEWQDLFGHAVAEADRLGLEFALATGPGWCGAGGPWVKPDDSMQHLVACETNVLGGTHFDAVLPRPLPHTPYFGKDKLTPPLAKEWSEFYRDEYVLAFPTPDGKTRIADIGEKAIYYRDPYSSKQGVKAFLPAPAEFSLSSTNECIAAARIIDLTDKLQPNGRLSWDVPPGNWTVMRFGRTLTGQTTRPAPEPGLGFETDKFSKAAMAAHFENFIKPLAERNRAHIHADRGWTTLHFDSWEMSAQNWTKNFRAEFQKRRGYDPLPWLPALSGHVVDNQEMSERFLWDLRQTAQELVIQNQIGSIKEFGAQLGLKKLSVEPYDLNPCADLELAAPADVPQCEFWAQGHGFTTDFSAFEAVSIAHTLGRTVTAAESFTSAPGEDWKLFPGAMKNQGDWALCCGINRFIFHRYQHQPWLDRAPGMTFASYGVHWDRTETWWDMVPAYHLYLARCQALLRRGQPVADILYLTPEGAPMVFRPPSSALTDGLPDRHGYNFDGVAPTALLNEAVVKDGKIIFPGGMSYRLLVLPEFETMTPRLLAKIKELIEAGATVIGAPPKKSPGLENFPACDAQVEQLAKELWGDGQPLAEQKIGKGCLLFDAGIKTRNPVEKITNQTKTDGIYPNYSVTAEILSRMGVSPDFSTDGDVRYIHRHDGAAEIYFVASRTNAAQKAVCQFRVVGRQPELWNPVTGERRDLPDFSESHGVTSLPLEFAANESYFVIFRKAGNPVESAEKNFAPSETILPLTMPWTVAFDPKWGGPTNVVFTELQDWSQSADAGIKYYSGKAVYRTQFDFNDAGAPGKKLFLVLGDMNGMASVKLNGQDLGVAWCPPWRVAVAREILRAKNNQLEITVANLWPNRLIGDLNLPVEKRLAWTTRNPFKKESPLLPSGLLGPVALQVSAQ